MDTVTFETAVKLKEAGFPQAKPQPNQVWYRTSGQKKHVAFSVIHGNDEKSEDRYLDNDHLVGVYLDAETHNDIAFKSNVSKNFVFAPAATDILRELKGDWALRFHEASNQFKCTKLDGHYIAPVGSWHKNPAEACAIAYLKLKE